MYPVSDGFLRAAKSNTRKYFWMGTIVTIAILLINANSRCVEPPFAIVRTYCF